MSKPALKVGDLQSTKLKIITEEELKEKNYSLEELWSLMINNQPIGPYLESELKEFVRHHQDISPYTLIANEKDHQWVMIKDLWPKEVVHLQEQLKDIYVNSRGVLFGPLEEEGFYEALKKNEFFISDQISLDHGMSWEKIDEWKLLRPNIKKHHEDLPKYPPNVELIKEGRREVLQLLNSNEKKKTKKADDKLLGLAYMGQVRPVMGQDEENEKEVESLKGAGESNQAAGDRDITHEFKMSSYALETTYYQRRLKKYFSVFLLGLVFSVIIFFLYFKYFAHGPSSFSEKIDQLTGRNKKLDQQLDNIIDQSKIPSIQVKDKLQKINSQKINPQEIIRPNVNDSNNINNGRAPNSEILAPQKQTNVEQELQEKYGGDYEVNPADEASTSENAYPNGIVRQGPNTSVGYGSTSAPINAYPQHSTIDREEYYDDNGRMIMQEGIVIDPAQLRDAVDAEMQDDFLPEPSMDVGPSDYQDNNLPDDSYIP